MDTDTALLIAAVTILGVILFFIVVVVWWKWKRKKGLVAANDQYEFLRDTRLFSLDPKQ